MWYMYNACKIGWRLHLLINARSMIPKHDSFDLIVPFILNGRFQKGQFISADFTLSRRDRQYIRKTILFAHSNQFTVGV